MKITDFTPGEAVGLANLTEGNWYIWETTGWSMPKYQAVWLGHKSGDYFKAIAVSGGNSFHGVFDFSPTQYAKLVESNNSQKQGLRGQRLASYSSAFFRPATPPAWTPDLESMVLWNGLRNATRPASGSDPEVFVEDGAGNIIPAYTFLKSKKESPQMFWDGFQAEFTPLPYYCMDEHGRQIQACLGALQAKLPLGARFSAQSVVEIPESTRESALEEHIDFGCRPSLNAYGLRAEVVRDPRDFPLRFAGGHFHWGIRGLYLDSPNFKANVAEGIKFLDATIGLAGVSMFANLDDPRRRRYYGLAGEYRLPAHGVEYRVLSNAWLASSHIYHLLFTLGRIALLAGFQGYRSKLVKTPEAEIVQAINSTDPDMARRLILQNEDLWYNLIDQSWGARHFDQTFKAILNPIEDLGIRMEDMYSNWMTLGTDGSRRQSGPHGYVARWSTYLRYGIPKEKNVVSTPAPLPITLSDVSGPSVSI